MWLEDHLGQGLAQQVLVGIPPRTDVAGEEVERSLNGCLDDDGPADGGGVGVDAHGASLVAVWSVALDCSTAALKAVRDRVQNESK